MEAKRNVELTFSTVLSAPSGLKSILTSFVRTSCSGDKNDVTTMFFVLQMNPLKKTYKKAKENYILVFELQNLSKEINITPFWHKQVKICVIQEYYHLNWS